MKRVKTTIRVAALLGIAILAYSADAKQPKQISSRPSDDIAPPRHRPIYERAEIAAYDPATRRIFGINPSQTRVDVLDISDPSHPTLAFSIALGGRAEQRGDPRRDRRRAL